MKIKKIAVKAAKIINDEIFNTFLDIEIKINEITKKNFESKKIENSFDVPKFIYF
jgi:hypothetical protein